MQPLLLVLALCVAQTYALFGGSPADYNDSYDEDTGMQPPWQPEPLKPAPWQSEPQYSQPHEAIVTVPEVGHISGIKNFKTIANRPVNAFLGLRYAKVGGGLARFQAAQPIGFQGRVSATEKSPNCAQFPELDRLRDSESRGENVDDCLTLDIYAPDGASQLPVLVFVHGEMLFDGGSEEAQPDYVLEKDVLLVSINYRLAPFGFLSALSDELPGNVALSDLHLALEWLQRNLAYFGGNPDKVTLVGQAGGATLAHALSLSGRANKLFQQLILQSGTALNPYLIDEEPLETLHTFARLARCPPFHLSSHGLASIYDCLSRLSTSQLVAAFEKLLVQNEPLGLAHLGGFKLVVGDSLGYLPSHPVSMVTNGSLALPTIFGATKDASSFVISRIYDQIARLQSHNVSDFIDVVLRHTAPSRDHPKWKQWALREIFSPEQQFTASLKSVANGLLELSNYILYRAPVINTIRNRWTPAYLYIFDYRGQYHRFGHLSNPLPFGVDASLSDDSVYLFPYPPEASYLNPLDRSLSRNLVTMWVNFAATGVPNPNPGEWPQASSEYGPVLRFTNSRQNPLELDQHFGEGINVPENSLVRFKPAINSTVPTTSTTTTTTNRPYAINPYANWQIRPPQQQTWHPADPEYVRAQEARQQQFILEREQRWRQQQQRRPQQESRQQEEVPFHQQQWREGQQREQQERERQQQEQAERVRQQREREELERRQREREQEEREQREREQQEREHQEREQQEREHRERQGKGQDQQSANTPPVDDNNSWGYSTYNNEQQQREQQEREQQRREQKVQDQQERDREQREREQQEREQQLENIPEGDRQPYPSYEHFEHEDNENPSELDSAHNYKEEEDREQQRQEQLRREQQEHSEREYHLQQEREQQERTQDYQPEDRPEDYPSYEEYIKAHEAKNAERYYAEEQERERQQQEQLHQERQERPEESLPDERQAYPTYDTYDPDVNNAGKQEREEQRRDQVEQERDQKHGDDQGAEYERSHEEGTEQEGLKVEDFPSYEAYVEAETRLREKQEEAERLEDERNRAQQEEEDRVQAERQSNPPRQISQLRSLVIGPQHMKLFSRQ
ncbi:glutactin [Drosophila biarmipes]|uniref:glutactin n=1 Tax=Drosophila biarmipes TaxID=125945 RepID=UPI0007E7ACA8|nr:glutactin [Drosophila biarmipes]